MTNSLSRHPSQPPEDWDHPELTTDAATTTANTAASTSTSTLTRVVFPSQGGGGCDGTAADDNDVSSGPDPLQSHRGSHPGKRTLSELLKIHAEKGTDVHFTTEEAARLEETLGRWINSCSSPYEGEDEFFTRSHDDSIVLVHRSSTFHCIVGHPPHVQSESIALES